MHKRAIMLLVLAAIVGAMVLGFSGAASAEQLWGTGGAEQITGSREADSVFGLGSDDLLGGDPTQFGSGGDDAMYGGVGDDAVFGRSGDDLVRGGWGDDVLGGTLGADAVYGDAGHDLLVDGTLSDGWSDLLSGGAGDDELDAYNEPANADKIVCGPGEDVVYTDGSDWVASDCEEVVAGASPDDQWKAAPYSIFGN